MRHYIGTIVFALGLGVFMVAPVANAQYATINAGVFIDVNSDSLQNEPDEVLTDGWQFELYDSSNNLLNSVASQASEVQLDLTDVATICITPQAGWTQTYPLTGSYHPSNIEWLCFENASSQDELVLFGVTEPELEEVPRIIDEGNTEAINKEPEPSPEPEVLGIIDESEPEVLAETGAPAYLVPIVGILLITSVIKLAKHRELA